MKKADWKEKLRKKLYSYLDKYDNFMGDKITAKVMNKENRKFVFFISSQIKQAEKRGYEKGRKENLMMIDKKVTEHFNKALKYESSDLVEMIRKDERKKMVELVKARRDIEGKRSKNATTEKDYKSGKYIGLDYAVDILEDAI